jgi:hypothetical protein
MTPDLTTVRTIETFLHTEMITLAANQLSIGLPHTGSVIRMNHRTDVELGEFLETVAKHLLQRRIGVGDISLQITDSDPDRRFGEHRAELRLARREGLLGLPTRAQPRSIDRILFIEAALAQRTGVAGGHAGGQLRNPAGDIGAVRD